eukprot:8853455-Ditylum_brightwellii.AAC.2
MHNLVAVAELCDSGCKVIFDEEDIVVQKDGENVVKGLRDLLTRLWQIPIVDKPAQITEAPPEYANAAVAPMEYANAAVAVNSANYTMHLANSVYGCNTQKELIQFYHATMLSLVKKMLLEAARWGYLQGWSGLTQAAIRKQIDIEYAMVKGHLNQVRQGIHSTQEKHIEPECIQEPKNNKTNRVYATIADLSGVIYTDQTG